MGSTELKSLFEQVLTGESGRMVVITQTPFLCAAVNDNGRVALFARVSLAPSQTISDGRGFSVKTTRSGNNDYVQLTATDSGLPPLFLKLVEYVLERVTATSTVARGEEALIRAIEEFRRFVSQRRGRLSESMTRGTFAELWFLQTLVTNGMTVEEAVAAWRGPWAKLGLGVHDFTFANGRGVEVKSTHQPPNTIRVSSPGQLVPGDQPLDLLVLPIEDAPSASNDAIPFREWVQETGRSFATTPQVEDEWEEALAALGLDLSDEWYDRYRFLPGEWVRFEVREGFPHLNISSLPPGIVDVRYSLELPRLAPFSAPLDDLLRGMGLP